MTNEETRDAIEKVRKRLHSMLDKLEKMKREQEEDLKTVTDAERARTEVALAQTQKLIEEIKTSQANIEAVLKEKFSG
jgi:hypothetical protein